MKKLFVIFISFLIFLPISANSLEKGKWIFIKDESWCYIGSLPTETDLPKEKKRGDNYILIYKLIGNDENIIQVEAGYNYNLDSDISVSIDQSKYSF